MQPTPTAAPMAPATPTPAPAAPPAGAGAGAGPDYMQMHTQFSGMLPPDPNTFLKLIWPILTKHQQDLVTALLTHPQGGAAGAAPAAGVPAPGASPAGA